MAKNLYVSFQEMNTGEANYIANKIAVLKHDEDLNNNDFAILYRTNTQSRALEDILLREGIPYKVVGGYKFYERKEIKDAIAYLRLIANPKDNVSLMRIINEPKRGIGNVSVDKLYTLSTSQNESIFEILKKADEYRNGSY